MSQEDIVINMVGQEIFNREKNWEKALHDIVEVKELPLERLRQKG